MIFTNKTHILKDKNTNFKFTIIAVTCAALNVENGQLTYNDSRVTNQGYPVATMATLTCDRGYALAGSASSICQTSGEWEQPVPNCNLGNECKTN